MIYIYIRRVYKKGITYLWYIHKIQHKFSVIMTSMGYAIVQIFHNEKNPILNKNIYLGGVQKSRH